MPSVRTCSAHLLARRRRHPRRSTCLHFPLRRWASAFVQMAACLPWPAQFPSARVPGGGWMDAGDVGDGMEMGGGLTGRD